MITLALLKNWLYIDQLGQSSVVACGPQRARRIYHGD